MLVEQQQPRRGRAGCAARPGGTSEPAQPLGQRPGQSGEQRDLLLPERRARPHAKEADHTPRPLADPQHGAQLVIDTLDPEQAAKACATRGQIAGGRAQTGRRDGGAGQIPESEHVLLQKLALPVGGTAFT
ncbi:hypothetical protein GCM10018965_007780 [Nonomuraea roseola]